MSWMDSWSRPTKYAAIPPPFYLLPQKGDAQLYCQTCGRLIASRKAQSHASPLKYCSSRCRHAKPGQIDRQIERTFVALLNGEQIPLLEPISSSSPIPGQQSGPEVNRLHQMRRKGETHIVVSCETVEAALFGPRTDGDKIFGRKKNRARRGVPDPALWTSVDMEDRAPPSKEQASTESDDQSDGNTESDEHDYENDNIEIDKDYIYFGGGKVRAPQSLAEVNGSVGGEKGWAERIEETTEMLKKRAAGQRRAEEREMVRRAARRGCAFGFVISTDEGLGGTDKDEQTGRKTKNKKGKNAKPQLDGAAVFVDGHIRRKCEAIMNGQAVEASFAKGDWGIRWREDAPT